MAFTGRPMKVVLKSRVSSVAELRNVFYGDYQGADADIPTTLDGYFNRLFPAGFLALFSSVFNIYNYDYYIWDGNEWQPTGSVDFAKLGTGSPTTYFALQAALVVIAKTAVKRTFGRKFWSAGLEAVADGGVLISSTVTALTTFAGNWISSYDSGTGIFTPALWGKDHALHEYTAAIVDVLMGTQVRRKPLVGI